MAALLTAVRPVPAAGGWERALDLSLAAIPAGIAIQLVPFPAGLTAVLSPARWAYLRATSLRAEPAAFLPLSVDPAATAHALACAVLASATFWTARQILSRGGVRMVVTAVAWTAIALVIVVFAQAASGTTRVYGVWTPADAGAVPFGPFINRNHAGAWALLALFLCFGCLQWRRATSAAGHGWSWRARLAHALDARTVILALGIVLLAAAIAAAASRSTLGALAAAAACVALAAPRRGPIPKRGLASALVLAAVFAMLAYADPGRVALRIDETVQQGLSGRTAIWRDAAGVLRDFPLTGAGAGAFTAVMRVYQSGDRTYYWNEAHNHYLQVLAEGGLLLGVPATVGLMALVVLGVRALRAPADPLRWMRLGAAAALLSVAVQSVWETSLTVPANAMLAAVAAAILVGRRGLPERCQDDPAEAWIAQQRERRLPMPVEVPRLTEQRNDPVHRRQMQERIDRRVVEAGDERAEGEPGPQLGPEPGLPLCLVGAQ